MISADLPRNAPVTTKERAAAVVLGRALALAMRDSAVRSEIKQAIAASSAPEHKIELASFLEGRGGDVLSASKANGGPDAAAVQRAIAQLRRLEFYMPVQAHTRQWRGGGNLILAVWQGDDVAPVGFDLGGTPVSLDLYHPPATPVLVAVPVESDLSAQVLPNRQGLGVACASGPSETLAEAGERCGASSLRANASYAGPIRQRDLGSDPNAVGLYMTFLRLLDTHEPWPLGNPEIEVHVTGKRSPDPAQPVDFQCAGEHAADPLGYQPGVRSQSYVFDMNDGFWSGSVMLLSPSQVDTLQANLPDGFNVSVWEDDDTSCQLKQDHTGLFQAAVQTTQTISNGVNAVRVHNYGLLATSIQSLATLILGGDDYAGSYCLKEWK